MTVFFPVSYIVLWVLVITLCLLVVGLLQQVGLLQRQLRISSIHEDSSDPIMPSVENDGPAIGSSLPEFSLEAINGAGTFIFPSKDTQKSTLLLFLSPTCEGCQHVVDPVNQLIDSEKYDGRAIAILRSDEEGSQAFLSVFPLHIPTVCDRKRTITKSFDVHRTPFGLLYDTHGLLIRKGMVREKDDLLALLGDSSALSTHQSTIFPPMIVAQPAL